MMRIMEAPKKGGKTRQLLLWASDHANAVIITATAEEQERLRRLIEEEEWSIDVQRVLSANVALRGLPRFGPDVEVAIDNLDWWLNMHFGRVVRYGTITVDTAPLRLRRSPRFDMDQDDSREKE